MIELNDVFFDYCVYFNKHEYNHYSDFLCLEISFKIETTVKKKLDTTMLNRLKEKDEFPLEKIGQEIEKHVGIKK